MNGAALILAAIKMGVAASSVNLMVLRRVEERAVSNVRSFGLMMAIECV